MNYRISRSDPLIEPVSLQEARTQCRVMENHWDDRLTLTIKAARAFAEQFTGRLLARSLCSAVGSRLYDAIDLASPLVSVESITYYDVDNVQQIMPEGSYYVDTYSQPGRILRTVGGSWPSIYNRHDAVAVSFTAGYADCPEDIRAAILLTVSHLFDNDSSTASGLSELPLGVDSLLHPYRIVRAR